MIWVLRVYYFILIVAFLAWIVEEFIKTLRGK